MVPLLFVQSAIQIEGRTDQGEVGEIPGKVAEKLSALTCFFCAEAKVVGKSQHLFEDQAGLLQPFGGVSACSCEGLDKPEGADVECAFFCRLQR